jgi:acyl-CoA reductase-like NAD-dependent aldehyde dehydrogenase
MIRSVSPQQPADVLFEAPEPSTAELDGAVERARKAQRDWMTLSATSRSAALVACADALERAAAELVELGIAEVGKPRKEMAGELARSVGILRYYAQAALDPDGDSLPSADGRTMSVSRRRPHGVVGLITPWNFPVAIPIWKIAPALAYGNTVVCKPAPAATAIALRVAEILAPQLPPGTLEVIPGDRAVGGALLAAVDALSFTGSVAVGRHLAPAAAGRGIPFQAEMGGLNPSIVFPDASLGPAAAVIAGAAMAYAGQKCTATSRVIVVGDPEPFTEALVAAIESLTVGDPADPAVTVGPVISETARRAVLDAVDEARGAGGRILTGGRALRSDGFFVGPKLIDGLSPDARLAQEEVFGPLALVLAARDDADALRIANGVAYGLSAAVFTTDLDRALAASGQLEAGMVRVNGPTTGADYWAPFGGTKASSNGPREQGKSAREFYTWTQTLTISPSG